MRRYRLSACSLAVGVLLCTAGIAVADSVTPDRFHPARDTSLVSVTNPLDGKIWSAWTYGQGAESDIAISFLDGRGDWSEPKLIGVDDGRAQVDPAITFDRNGHLYLAWSEAKTGRVLVTARSHDTGLWTSPKLIAKANGSAPAVIVAGGQKLVVGFIANDKVRLVELRLLSKLVQIQLTDGPDPVGFSDDDGSSEPPPGGDDENESGFNDHGVMAELEYLGQVTRKDDVR